MIRARQKKAFHGLTEERFSKLMEEQERLCKEIFEDKALEQFFKCFIKLIKILNKNKLPIVVCLGRFSFNYFLILYRKLFDDLNDD